MTLRIVNCSPHRLPIKLCVSVRYSEGQPVVCFRVSTGEVTTCTDLVLQQDAVDEQSSDVLLLAVELCRNQDNTGIRESF